MAIDKLVDSSQLDNNLTLVANAIRTKGGTSASLIFPTDFVTAINAISDGGGGSSATQHSIYLEFLDETNTTVPIYYNDSAVSSIITNSKPFMYNNKQVTLAKLDGITWFSPKPIPLNTQLIDFTKVKDHYGIDGTGEEEEYEWSSVTDYILVDRIMTFSYINYRWFGIFFYDINKEFIKYITPQDNGATIDEDDYGHGTLDGSNIPPNAEYVRMVTSLSPDNTTASVIRTA